MKLVNSGNEPNTLPGEPLTFVYTAKLTPFEIPAGRPVMLPMPTSICETATSAEGVNCVATLAPGTISQPVEVLNEIGEPRLLKTTESACADFTEQRLKTTAIAHTQPTPKRDIFSLIIRILPPIAPSAAAFYHETLKTYPPGDRVFMVILVKSGAGGPSGTRRAMDQAAEIPKI